MELNQKLELLIPLNVLHRYTLKVTYNVLRVWEVRDKIVLMFQFKNDFTDTKIPLNLALNPHLLYTLLVAVYLIYIYFKNICNFIRLRKNKLYICKRIKEVIYIANSKTYKI